jgi:hypothetical protein
MPIATLTLSGTITGEPDGSVTLGPTTDTANAALDYVQPVMLGTSFTQITVPAGATHVMVYLPANNTFNVTLAGTNTDTGIGIGASGWSKIPLAAGATLYAKASGAMAAATVFRFC